MLTRTALVPVATLAVGVACGGGAGSGPGLPPGDYTPRTLPPRLAVAPERATALREDALARAQVWREPAVAIAQADLLDNPGGPGSFRVTDELSCRFLPRSAAGRTPKFQCVLAGGDVIKVKYGRSNRERLAEVAGSRLARALGFGADHMYVVRRVRCWGCPPYPYPKLPWLDALLTNYRRPTEFEDVAVERPFEGQAIRTPQVEGWSWRELDRVQTERGGASLAQLDALRLLAAFLNHWDSKPENQKLVCLPGGQDAEGGCARPFAFIDDFGATFGPRRADLRGWTEHPVWADPEGCGVSLRDLPYQGGTFPDRRISEEGRRFLAGLLTQLRPAQVHDLFVGARFGQDDEAGQAVVAQWVRAFEDRVRQIADRGGPCPGP